ncbi:MAG TPA: site-2 protease family protein [Terriglobia bacterium]|nr:site-2 protease family protein [Terriglobia bacterium]
MTSTTVALGLLWYVAFLLSLACHEGAHALAAKLGGDPTAFLAGSMTLNPVPHIRREPFGTVVVPILSYLAAGWMIGWASAPYDPAWRRQYPRRAAWMALAGPAANLALALAAALAIRSGMALGTFVSPAQVSFTHVTTVPPGGSAMAGAAADLLSILFSLNLLLATFNLLPVPPLDGNAAIGLLLPEGISRRLADASRNRTLALVGLLIAWKVFDLFFRPVFITALGLLYPGAGYQ